MEFDYHQLQLYRHKKVNRGQYIFYQFFSIQVHECKKQNYYLFYIYLLMLNL